MVAHTGVGDYGDYKRLRLLGSGRQGRVYEAVCLSDLNPRVRLNQTVALNVLAREASGNKPQRFLRQTANLMALSHPNIVRYFESFVHPVNEWDEDLCLVMEFLAGDDLKSLISYNPKGIPWERCEPIFEQCLRGLIAAAAHGVYHRDLKPSNILLLPDGTVKLIDFGIAHFDDGGTTTGGFKGAFDYMAPDIVLEPARPNYRACDIFSFGVCLYECLTGVLPFPALGQNAQNDYIERWRSATPPELSLSHPIFRAYPGVRALLRTCLAVRSHDRYRSFEHVLEALRHVRAQGVLHANGEDGVVSARGLNDDEPSSHFTPPLEVARAVGTKPVQSDDVQFTVFRPQVVAPNTWCLMLAFAHLSTRRPDAPPDDPDPLQEVQRQARQALAEEFQDYSQLTQDGTEAIPSKGEITFLPEISGIEFNPPRSMFRWMETVHRQDFRLRASPELDGKTARGRLTVFLGTRIIADVPLKICVEAKSHQHARITEVESAGPYRKVFASYSHKDAKIVEDFEYCAIAFGDQYLRDAITLRTGEVWSERLAAMIREADIFQLFWSNSSMRSDYVRQEWEHALSLNREHFVRPVYWEEPRPEDKNHGLPPDALARIHFQRLTRHSLSGGNHALGSEIDPTVAMLQTVEATGDVGPPPGAPIGSQVKASQVASETPSQKLPDGEPVEISMQRVARTIRQSVERVTGSATSAQDCVVPEVPVRKPDGAPEEESSASTTRGGPDSAIRDMCRWDGRTRSSARRRHTITRPLLVPRVIAVAICIIVSAWFIQVPRCDTQATAIAADVKALQAAEHTFGPNHPNTAHALNNLARRYTTLGHYTDAEPLYRRSLAIYQNIFGPDSPDVATALNDLARLYKAQGQYALAERLCRRAEAAWMKSLGLVLDSTTNNIRDSLHGDQQFDLMNDQVVRVYDAPLPHLAYPHLCAIYWFRPTKAAAAMDLTTP